MTEERASSPASDDEAVPGPSPLETAALARKKRLLEMKSRLHGIEMKEEDFEKEEVVTKKSREGNMNSFRSYQPFNEAVGNRDIDQDLFVVEKEIASHLEDTKDTKVIETVDLATLAPRKVDWDLKRDLEGKLAKLERRTQRAIAELIRKRLAEGDGGDLAAAVNAATQ